MRRREHRQTDNRLRKGWANNTGVCQTSLLVFMTKFNSYLSGCVKTKIESRLGAELGSTLSFGNLILIGGRYGFPDNYDTFILRLYFALEYVNEALVYQFHQLYGICVFIFHSLVM